MKEQTASRREVLKSLGCSCFALSLFDVFRQRCGFAAAEIAVPPVLDVLEVLPPQAVQLRGYLDRYIRLSISKWNKGVVPYQALADFYRVGRPKVMEEGREIELFATGEMWGKAVRSAALFYRYTADPELKTILRSTVSDLLSTRRANGTISCSQVSAQPDGSGGDLWERAHVLLALDEYYTFVEADPAVLAAMIDEADATLSQVGPPPKTRIVDLGWSHNLVQGNNIESSAILEPMVRLYKRTRYPRYLDFARYIVEAEGGALHHRIFDELLAGEDLVAVGGVYPKAYEMTFLFQGLVEYYRVTGSPRWQQACLQFLQKVIQKEITIVGNGGGDQPYHPNVAGEAWDNTAVEQTNPDMHRMMETCTGVAWLQFCHQMLRLTGMPAAADYLELYAYNGLIGAMKPEGDGFSYVNLLNGVKTNKIGWGTDVMGVYVTCCNLNGPEGLAYLPWAAVMADREGPVIVLYNAASVNLTDGPAGRTRLVIETNYPLDGFVRVRVMPEVAREFAVKLRIPGWSQQTVLKVNGKSVPVQPGSFASVARRWARDDVIDLHLDMRCRLVRAQHGLSEYSDRFVALVRGPVVLARDENIDPRFNEPVDIVAPDGIVPVRPVRPTHAEANMQFEVPTRTGLIQMVDYASVNSWGGSRVQTWLPVACRESSV